MPFKPAHVDNEYAKDKQLKQEDVHILLEWVAKQPHLPEISELQAVLFLQSCYYRLEPAKKALDNFFTCRTLCPDIFNVQFSESGLKLTLECTLVTVLPKQTPDGYAIVFTKLTDLNPDKYDFTGQVKFFDMVLMLHMNRFGTCKGIATVTDMEGGSLSHMAKFNLSTAKRFFFYLQEAMPIRLKAIHLFNVVPFIDKVMMLIKPFMKKEMLNLINLHTSNMETLYKYVPQSCLPSEYGGDAPSRQKLQAASMEAIMDNADYFDQVGRQKVDESRRPGKPKNAGDIFGVDGTFKKLEFD